MGDLTTNFDRKEFACKCGCGFDTIDVQTVLALQSCVDSFKIGNKKVSMTINCGCRCKRHNDALRVQYSATKGKQGENTAPNSQHIYGRAADIVLMVDGKQLSPIVVAEYFATHYEKFSIGTYPTFTHIDSRTSGPARW